MKRRIAMASALVAVALCAAAALYVRSDAFQARVARFIGAQIEAQLGLTPHYGRFHFTWRPLGFSYDDLALQGRESAAQPPLAAMPRVEVRVDAHALRHGRVVLDAVRVVAPVVHLYPLADGALNLPLPRAGSAGVVPPLLFQFQVQHLVATPGELWLRDRRLPIALDLGAVNLELRARGSDYLGEVTFHGDPGAVGSWRPGAVAVTAHFVLGVNRLQIGRLEASNAAGRVTLQGGVPDLDHAAFQGMWQMTGEAPAAARQLGYDGLAAGNFTARGSAAWDAAGYRLAGGFEFAGARLRPPAPPVATWSGEGAFHADAGGVTLDRARLQGLASEVTLSGAWRNGGWQARAGFSGLDLAALQPLLRYERLDPRLQGSVAALAARLAGDLTIASRGAAPPAAQLEVTLSPDPAAGSRLAATGSATLQFGNGAIDLSQLELEFAGNHLTASGNLPVNLHLHLDSGDVRNLAPVAQPWLATLAAAAPQIPPPGWNRVGGAVQLDATINGSGASRIRVAATAQQLQWGEWRADTLALAMGGGPAGWQVQRLALRQGAQTLSVAGSLGAVNYLPAMDRPFAMHLEASEIAVTEWRAWLGLGEPVTGTIDVSADLSGTPAAPTGEGRFASAALAWGSQPLGAFSGNFSADRGHVEIPDLAVALGPSHLRGSLRLDLAAHRYAATLQSADADLDEFQALQSGRVRVSGPARVQFTGEGDWREPQGLLTVSAPRTVATLIGTPGFEAGSESLGDVECTLRLAQGRMTFQLGDLLPTGGLSAQGSVETAAPHAIDATLQLSGYDFDAWLRRFTALPLTAHSLATGSVRIDGPLDEPQRLTASADFAAIAFSLAGRRFRNQGPVRLVGDPAGVRIAAAHFVAPHFDLTFGGRVLAGRSLRLDLALAGTADLGLLGDIDPELRAGGQVDINATLAGSLDQPQLGGAIALRDGSLAEAGVPVALEQINGRIRLTGNRAQIETLTARSGGGTLSLSGFASRSGGNYLVDISATGRDTRVRYLGVSAAGNLDLRVVAQRSGALIAGSLTLTRISLGDDFDLAAFIANSRLSTPSAPSNSALGRVRLDVRLSTGPQLELTSAGAQLELQADLRLRGTLAEPSLLGQAGASQGSVFFAGYRYRVDKGLVEFTNPFRIEPMLDLGLSTTIPPYDVTLNITGPADKLNITYRSDPPLSSADIVNLLATGTPTQATGTLSQQAAGTFAGQSEQLLGRALQNAVSGRLQRLFGITQVEVSPNTVINGAASSGSSVVIQQQVSRNLKLTYTENLSSSAQDIVQIEWTLTRNLGLTLSRDQFGLYGLQFELHRRAR